jgi:acylphosphatase
MLLLELRPDLPQSAKKVQIPITKNAKQLGMGIQGFARKFLGRPNTVVKVALMGKQDAYEEFIKIVINHQDNPFFPRIHAVKKYRIDALDMSDYEFLANRLGSSISPGMEEDILDNMTWMVIIVMEELKSAENRKYEHAVVQNITQLFGENVMKQIYEILGRDDDMDVDTLLSALSQVFICKQVIKDTPNPKFRDALRLMVPLLNKFYADIRGSNVMVRLSAQGPQLVFIDPVFSHPNDFKTDYGSYILGL